MESDHGTLKIAFKTEGIKRNVLASLAGSTLIKKGITSTLGKRKRGVRERSCSHLLREDLYIVLSYVCDLKTES